MRRAGVSLLLLAALFAVPATASAQRQVSYKVTVDGEGTYSYDATHELTHVTHAAHFKWHTEIPILLFDGDKPITQSAENVMGATSTGTLLSAHSTFSAPSSTEDCAPAGVTFANPGRLLPDDGIVPSPNPTIGIRTVGSILFGTGTCAGGSGFSIQGVLVNGSHMFDTFFSVPRDVIGMGRIINLVHEVVTDKRCPYNNLGDSNCNLTWDASITLDKFYDSGPEGSSGGGSSNGSGGGSGKAPAGKGGKVRPSAAKLSLDAAKAILLMTCLADDSCEGIVTATLPRGHRSSAAKARVLARSKFKVAAGTSKRVVVRFSHAARRKIRHAGGVSLRVRTVSAGKAAERVLSLRLKGGAR
jgi:hypothetical protein